MILRSRRFGIVSPNRQILLRIEEGTRTSEPSQLNTSDKTNVEIPTPDFELISNPIQIPFAKPPNLIRQNLSTFLTANDVAESYDADSEDERLFGEMDITTFEEKFGLLNRERPTCSNEARSLLNYPNWEAIYHHWKKKTQQTGAEAVAFPADSIGKKPDNNPYVCFRPVAHPRAPVPVRKATWKNLLEQQTEYERKHQIFIKASEQLQYLTETRSMLKERIKSYHEEMFEIKSDFRQLKKRKKFLDRKLNGAED